MFALVRWEVARACVDPGCSSGCAKIHDEAGALDLVLTERAMLSVVEEDHPELIEIGINNLDFFDGGDWPVWVRPVSPSLAGPHPERESREEYDRRVGAAWNAAVAVLKAEGLNIEERPSLAIHCEWLVRRQVLRQQWTTIARDAPQVGVRQNKGNSVSVSARRLAEFIGLSITELLR